MEVFYDLIDTCKKHGLEFSSLYLHNGRYVVTAHDPKLAGKKPEVTEMRDAIDYWYLMDSWRRRGIVILSEDSDPFGAINLAIEYLEKSDK